MSLIHILQLIFVSTYAIIVTLYCLYLDIIIEDNEKGSDDTNVKEINFEVGKTAKVYQVIFVAEFVILVLFIFDFILHTIGYGTLFNCTCNAIMSWIFLVVNTGILIAFGFKESLISSYFGTKLLASIILLNLRLETIRVKFFSKAKIGFSLRGQNESENLNA